MGSERRVVVTGLGVVSALGIDEHQFGERLFAGEGGIRRVDAFDLAGYRAVSGAQVDRQARAAAMAARRWPPVDPAVAMGLISSFQALAVSLSFNSWALRSGAFWTRRK